MDLRSRVEHALGHPVTSTHPLSGGCVADVVQAELAGGGMVVVKHGGTTYETEAVMLRALQERSGVPVPEVLHAEPDLLILEHIKHDGQLNEAVERDAADLLAELHGVAGEHFGFSQDTLIGPLVQPCPPAVSWVEFFGEYRLRHFGSRAHAQGAITSACWQRLQKLVDRLGDFLDEPEHPSLIHGDIWSGNVLCLGGRVAAFIDPATHYAHPEVELAFTTLFSTFGRAFFARYTQHRPIRPGFFEVRRGLYNLYPLLVHAILFGGGYGKQVEHGVEKLIR
ncbi:Ribulosamine/erythrulosamine 3-kinase potentially involved in protein deglycation [hydrothermal vent metagenome]|uniref:Ribulosamine/erythrulosamine 3-kinase potentially involved in protein deglycation n=1 Tax=hydrothermal vent metagenome TaxID=652676 RepID=A0A3B1DL36_9ZZZZ